MTIIGYLCITVATILLTYSLIKAAKALPFLTRVLSSAVKETIQMHKDDRLEKQERT